MTDCTHMHQGDLPSLRYGLTGSVSRHNGMACACAMFVLQFEGLKVYLQLGSKLSVTTGELHEDGTARNEEDGKSKQHPSFLCYSTCDATACVAACTFVM